MTKKVLLVKLSSMGDLIHALPALSDAQKAIQRIQFDWVIDEAFSDVATWHDSVHRIIKTAHRRWRKNLLQTLASGELKQLYRDLRHDHYDLVLDAQSNFKSALLTRLARGTRAGLDKASAAESIAALAYQRHFNVDKNQHAIARLRELFAKALNYELPQTPPDFGINLQKLSPSPISLPKSYFIFIHNASWETKWWPETYWKTLIKRAKQSDISVILPWGNMIEKARAERLAEKEDNVVVLPRLTLSQAATVIAGAKAAVCVDTGLGHLTAALNIPSISLYGPTDPGLIGATGAKQLHLHADFACAPCYQKKCTYTKPSSEHPACFTRLPPELVWDKLMSIILLS
ncbi:MAG: lipopolysaccharide heptosyltransferase [Gammaproteobacteria bacterium]|jgi:heptosyltransferase-1|nr:lipopolysaccharide heptosyltransferase [Gammaproteobacteria bacterium]